MRKPDTDETIGNNVHGIRIARRISMQEAVNGMRELGHYRKRRNHQRICRCTTEEAADLGKVDERGNQKKTL